MLSINKNEIISMYMCFVLFIQVLFEALTLREYSLYIKEL